MDDLIPAQRVQRNNDNSWEWDMSGAATLWRPLRKALLGVVIAGCGLTAPLTAHAAGSLIVNTRVGAVEGFSAKGVSEFLGIPYAEPPVGELRWAPPKPHSPWTEVLPAKAFGPTCAQISELGVFAGPANTNEDCLYLNVFAPKRRAHAKPLPVFVWIYGGALVDGEIGRAHV